MRICRVKSPAFSKCRAFWRPRKMRWVKSLLPQAKCLNSSAVVERHAARASVGRGGIINTPPVRRMPERQTLADPLCEDIEFGIGAGKRSCRIEMAICLDIAGFVVPDSHTNRFKNRLNHVVAPFFVGEVRLVGGFICRRRQLLFTAKSQRDASIRPPAWNVKKIGNYSAMIAGCFLRERPMDTNSHE